MSGYLHSPIKKSVYLFLSLLLGVFLFLIIHRLIIFSIMMFYLSHNPVGIYTVGYRQFLLLEYSTLVLAVMAGSWYGLWVGGYWYEKVYEVGLHGGALGHLVVGINRFTKKQSSLRTKVEQISKELKEEAWQLEDLAKMVAKPTKSIIVHKKKSASKKVISKKI